MHGCKPSSYYPIYPASHQLCLSHRRVSPPLPFLRPHVHPPQISIQSCGGVGGSVSRRFLRRRIRDPSSAGAGAPVHVDNPPPAPPSPSMRSPYTSSHPIAFLFYTNLQSSTTSLTTHALH